VVHEASAKQPSQRVHDESGISGLPQFARHRHLRCLTDACWSRWGVVRICVVPSRIRILQELWLWKLPREYVPPEFFPESDLLLSDPTHPSHGDVVVSTLVYLCARKLKINQFVGMLGEKREEVEQEQRHLNVGLSKLRDGHAPQASPSAAGIPYASPLPAAGICRWLPSGSARAPFLAFTLL